MNIAAVTGQTSRQCPTLQIRQWIADAFKSGRAILCYHQAVENRTEPKTVMQWVRYIVMALIALILVWGMLRMYVL